MRTLGALLVLAVLCLAGGASAEASSTDFAHWSCASQVAGFRPAVNATSTAVGVCVDDAQNAQSSVLYLQVTSITGTDCNWSATGQIWGMGRSDAFTLSVSGADGEIILRSGASGPFDPDAHSYARRCTGADHPPAPTAVHSAFAGHPVDAPSSTSSPTTSRACAATTTGYFDPGFASWSFSGTAACKGGLAAAAQAPIELWGSYTGTACGSSIWDGTLSVTGVIAPMPVHAVFHGGDGIFSNGGGALVGVGVLPWSGTSFCTHGGLLNPELTLALAG